MSILKKQEKLLNDIGILYIPSHENILYHLMSSKSPAFSDYKPYLELKTYREKLMFLTSSQAQELTKIWFDYHFDILCRTLIKKPYKCIFISIPQSITCYSFVFPPDVSFIAKWLIEEHQLFVSLFYNSTCMENAHLVISLENISIDYLSTYLNNRLLVYLQSAAIDDIDPTWSKREKMRIENKSWSYKDIVQITEDYIKKKYDLDPKCPIRFQKLFQQIKTNEEEEFELFNKPTIVSSDTSTKK